MTPDEGTIEWLFGIVEWWLESFGGFAELEVEANLPVPRDEYFPIDAALEGVALANDYLLFAMEHAGLTRWSVEMVMSDVPEEAAGLTPLEPETELLRDGEPLPIPFERAQLQEPVELIATIGRGLSFYFLKGAPTPVPADDEVTEELVVEVGAVMLGFGVFLCNAPASESGFNELDVSYVLALFLALLGRDSDEALEHLRPNPRGFVRAASRDLRHREEALQQLRNIGRNPTRDGPYR